MLTRETMTGPWAGLPVAWTGDDRFDEATFRADVARCCQAGVPGVYTGGTTGEFYAMEFDEFQAVARAAVEECRKHQTPVMIGCTSTYTLGAVRRAAFAAEIGADAIQVALPFWMQIAEDQILPFFKEVAHAAGDLALSVYETTRAKRTLTLAQHRAVKQAVPNYLMVKSNAETLGVTPDGCASLSEFVNVFVGENLWVKLGPQGARGCCSSMVYWLPKTVLALWNKVEQQDWEAVRSQSARIAACFSFLHEQFDRKGFTDTAYDRLGGIASGFLKTSLRNRGPYCAPTPSDVETLAAWFREHFPEECPS